MSKELPYFKFIATEWLTGDIVFEPLDVQGLFINICAIYWQRDGDLTIADLSRRYANSSERLAMLADRYIIVSDGKISIKFLDEQLFERAELSTKNSINGKKGGEAKAAKMSKKTKKNSDSLAFDSDGLANSSNKDKEEEKEEEKEKDKFWQKWTFAWHEHVLLKTNSKPVFSGKAVKNLKAIREYFLKQDNPTTGQKNAENEALFCFEYILKHWELLDSFKQKKFNLAYMAENIPEYLSDIKNAKSGKTAQNGQKTENKIDTAKNNLEKGLEALRKEAMQNAS
jgi:hypothetical protein